MANNYWEKINELDRKIAELTERARSTDSNQENAALIDEIYELRQDKKVLQRSQGLAIRRPRG